MHEGPRYAVSFAIPLLAALLLTPVAWRVARRLGILDHPADHKFHRNATPYLGGVAVAGALLLVAAVTAGASGQLLTILAGGLVLSVMGLLDDWRTVPLWVKVLVEVAAAVALWIVGVGAGLFGVAPLDLGLTVFWVVAVTNAFNLIDNMDGLLAGVAAISALTFFGVAAHEGDYLVASFALAVAGASVGFLRYNFPPARIFLGDAGSLLLGFLLAAIGLKLDLVGESGLTRTAIPVLIVGAPLFDTALVVVARRLGGRPVYVGGTDHSSHRLAALGLPEKAVAGVTYGFQVLCSVLALWMLRASDLGVLPAVALALGVGLLCLAALLRVGVGRPADAERRVVTVERDADLEERSPAVGSGRR
ncbi:MAG: undecaprenyl/decaprenyl-phosphate alpha-N-acetylglucosaminyl 1-phosphate transferase [Actinobacteria bacterium]|nr:undecaprenyl/decaprenyl-phosphate alpha-N-acetylglucosaminyl 1-phosphate transferase [Actinomycetota bacterium]